MPTDVAAPDVRAHHCDSSRCAQPGDNLVDRRGVSVRWAYLSWDGVWGAAATQRIVPRQFTDEGGLCTTERALDIRADLRKRQFSTVSTPPMTTSLRQGLRMTQAVRAAGRDPGSPAGPGKDRAGTGSTGRTGSTGSTGRTSGAGTAGRVGLV
jgi:hypothetical protein